jgi:hypothetical protein
MNKLILILSLFFCVGAGAAQVATSDLYSGPKSVPQFNHDHPNDPNCQSYFDWARGQNGWGYCYEFDNYGYVLNNGRPMHPMNCERVHPSFFDWARGWDGYIYCFQFTPYRDVMNDGRSVPPGYCR